MAERGTVLVLDDDEATRTACQLALDAVGYEATTAASGAEAAARLSDDPALRERCELVVTDYLMPGGDGFAVFDELRAIQPDLAGILLTGHTSLKLAVDALNRGFSQVVGKPVDTDYLVESVRTALGERRTMLENARLRTLTRLYDALHELAGIQEPEELYDCVVKLAVSETSAESASLMLLDDQRRNLRVVASRGLDAEVVREARRFFGEPIAGWALRHGMTLELAPHRPLPIAVRAALTRPELGAALCVPMMPAGRPLGVLNLSRAEAGAALRPGDLEVATVLASNGGLMIHRLHFLRERARRERVATVGRLASAIIHDLRGPVTIIQGAAELMEDLYPEHVPQLQSIEQQVAELDRTCEQLLSFARDRASGALERFTLGDLVTEVERLVAEQFAGAGVTLELKIEHDGPTEGPIEELTRCLAGMLQAACEAAAPGDVITLSSWQERSTSELTIAGRASDAATWWREVDAASALAAGGAVLSLAISEHVMARLNGRLEVECAADRYALSLSWPRSQPSSSVAAG